MIASKVSATVLLEAARSIGVITDVNSMSANRHRVKLYPDPSPDCYTRAGRRKTGPQGDARYQRESVGFGTAGRRVNAVCWHGFRDYFRAVYEHCPEAIFRTSLATWKGSEHFEANFPASGHKNIGPLIAPVEYAGACRCPEAGETGGRYNPYLAPARNYYPEPTQDDYGQDEADGAACRAMAAALAAARG